MLDILFAKRNKSYGAYAIRSAYGSTVFRSLFIVIFTVATSAGLAFWLKESPIAEDLTGQVFNKDSVYVIPFNPDKPDVDQPKTDPKTGGSKSTSGKIATLIKNDALDTAKQTTNTAFVPINTNTSTGDPGPGTTSLTGGGTNTNTSGGGTGDPKDPFELDSNPEFEGGHAALLAFVKKHLVYPPTAVEVGKQGTLYIKFVVDETGKISNILLQNNLGYGLDDEAMRVVKMIPKFKSPGKVKGQPVKTYYQIPIKFKLG